MRPQKSVITRGIGWPTGQVDLKTLAAQQSGQSIPAVGRPLLEPGIGA